MKKVLLFIFSVLLLVYSNAQNLVPNPSFEQYSSCPTAQCGISLATGWYSAGYTPDYYNVCGSSVGLTNWGVPQNSVGYQYAANGNAYAGFATWADGLREYIGATLISPLEVGNKYFVNFKVSHIDRFIYCANNKIGVLFSTISFNLRSDSCNLVAGLLPNNFSHVYTNQVITDTSNWVAISGSFIADSAYQYIIIGNHFDDNNTDTICLGQSHMGGYYLLDDIYVSTDSTLGFAESNIAQDIAVYPTITKDKIIVKTNTTSIANMKIYDLFGRLIVTQTLIPLIENEIALSEYNAGIYVLSLIIDNKRITKKIIITK